MELASPCAHYPAHSKEKVVSESIRLFEYRMPSNFKTMELFEVVTTWVTSLLEQLQSPVCKSRQPVKEKETRGISSAHVPLPNKCSPVFQYVRSNNEKEQEKEQQ